MKSVFVVMEKVWVIEQGADETRDLEYCLRYEAHDNVAFRTREEARAYADVRFSYAADVDIVELAVEDAP